MEPLPFRFLQIWECISKHSRHNQSCFQTWVLPTVPEQTHTFLLSPLPPPPTTCFSSDKYHLNASHLRQKNFQECARLAAITSNATAKVALKSMLKSEAATEAFGKPKHYVKGEHCTALQQVRITIFDSDSQPTVSTSLLQTP